jgi:hypothetical protein
MDHLLKIKIREVGPKSNRYPGILFGNQNDFSIGSTRTAINMLFYPGNRWEE